jgi:membrane protein
VKFENEHEPMKKKFVIFTLLKDTFEGFMEDNGLKLSAALSYYTMFSLAPMLLVIISLLTFFYGEQDVQSDLFAQITTLVGDGVASQLQEIIQNAQLSNKSGVAAAIGLVTLLIGATGVFAEIQDSINFIWNIKAKPKKGWVQYLVNRLLSFSIILTLGFLLLVFLIISAMADMLGNQIAKYFSEGAFVLLYLVNTALVFGVITALFTVIFKVLPDGKLRWKECLIGAGFTSILFLIGKFGISFYIGQSNLGVTYGASASIIILLTWIYYSSIILYFGAEFTKVYARMDGRGITPNRNAVLVERQEVDMRENPIEPTVR